jgi:hypothetical protein
MNLDMASARDRLHRLPVSSFNVVCDEALNIELRFCKC